MKKVKPHKKGLSQKSEMLAKIYSLDTIISNMPGFVYWKNKNSEYMGCNNNLLKVSGLKDKNDLLGKTDYDFEWGKNQAEQFREDDKIVMRDKIRNITEYTLPVKREDGNFLQIRTEKMPLFNAEEEVIGVLAIAVDITDHRLLEQDLRNEKERTERLNQSKSEFIRNMEHDIRTPFGGIYALAKILESSEPDTARKELLSDLIKCSKELLDYCNGILDFSKIEAGSLPVLNKKFDLRKLVSDVVSMEKPAAIEKGLKLSISYPENIPSVYIGDEYRVERVLINLLSNAIKFTHKGSIDVLVEVVKITDAINVVVRFQIIDTGIGIPKDKIEYIYEKFSRLTLSNTGQYKGAGLGLCIVKQLIEELCGEIEVISDPGVGSTFAFAIPLEKPLVDDMLI